jgi:hypothetical protein
MPINNHWRNKQLGNQLLWQEIQCLNFLKKHPTTQWQWYGAKGNFLNFCQDKINITTDTDGDGLIIINCPTQVSPRTFVNTIDKLTRHQPRVVYLAVNRYEFLSVNDLHIEYSDQIENSIDQILNRCCYTFQRLYYPQQVDGKHFVGVHGLDVFVYENN